MFYAYHINKMETYLDLGRCLTFRKIYQVKKSTFTQAQDQAESMKHLKHEIIVNDVIVHDFRQGVLDLLANRCLASGTNAWTDTDHTCYTMTTAGSEGFLNLMPIYLDHVLYPTLTVSIACKFCLFIHVLLIVLCVLPMLHNKQHKHYILSSIILMN